MTNAITTKGLELFYGDFQALKNVDLAIAPKKITALIGPSGCGKSTLLRVFNRMNDLIAGVKITGSINIFGKDLLEIDKNKLRRSVGMVFQRPNPFPLSIYENIVYGLKIHGIKKKGLLDEALFESLTAVNLWNDLKDRLKENAIKLSGEQQQRLCIARLIAVRPDILLMDEPCSALDPIATGHIEDLMKDLKKDYTIVIVTHNMQQAARVSDDCGFMLLGDLVEFGNTNRVFTAPSDKRTEDYITGRYG
ncbi:MAG: phosphate ABC transporter ATP-binding protein [Deltaproteobacteria bacterium CG11_big_fil_rev_8_21_14_0_20_49_13]|nr:MAG: phosphate ABC transporter ATP-binding protein [Deltaproteobacteria bacterium CG11_big_fil_rev_8_21_14_0_20_49_13]